MSAVFSVPFNDDLWPPVTIAHHLMYAWGDEYDWMHFRGWCPVCWRWWDMTSRAPVRCPYHIQFWLEVRPKARQLALVPSATQSPLPGMEVPA